MKSSVDEVKEKESQSIKETQKGDAESLTDLIDRYPSLNST